ncbi:MAG: hypothetical protein V4692_13155 [Bdellovibrionota bacterium]
MSGPNSDPFEEFEFQPLTEGLGFHKKAETVKSAATSDLKSTPAKERAQESNSPRFSLNANAQAAPIVQKETQSPIRSESISELMASLPPSLDFLDEKPDLTRKSASTPVAASASMSVSSSVSSSTSAMKPEAKLDLDRPQIFQPLGREEYKPQPAPTVSPAPKAPKFATTPMTATIPAPMASPYRERMSESFAKSFPRIEKTAAISEDLVPVPAGFASGVVDVMMVAGVSTVLLVCILQITQINLVGMLSNARTDGPTQMNLALLMLAVYHMYMLVSRAFFGASLGEWAFELQMGKSEEQIKPIYPIKVMWRTILMTLTGFIIIPLLSIVFNRDLAKYATGVQLYRHP